MVTCLYSYFSRLYSLYSIDVWNAPIHVLVNMDEVLVTHVHKYGHTYLRTMLVEKNLLFYEFSCWQVHFCRLFLSCLCGLGCSQHMLQTCGMRLWTSGLELRYVSNLHSFFMYTDEWQNVVSKTNFDVDIMIGLKGNLFTHKISPLK